MFKLLDKILESLVSKPCKYWREYDDPNGFLYEYCKARHIRVGCCGVYAQCHDGRYFNASQARVIALLKADRIDRAIDIAKLGLSVGKND